MLFSDSYFTISAPAEAVFRDRGSKFLAFAWPVQNETEIKAHLHLLRKEHPSANHHCYAWRLGADKSAFRSNDDGEPANSAGKPILSQLQSNDLTNVLIVVVRYFGGTLLGVSGLINAYKSAAAAVIAQTKIEERFILFEYKVDFDFDALSPLMRLLKEFESKIISQSYEEKNGIVFQTKKKYAEELESRFKDLYTCRLEFVRLV